MIITGKLIGITRIKTKENKEYKIGNFEYTDNNTYGKNVVNVFTNVIENKDINKEFKIYKNKNYTELII